MAQLAERPFPPGDYPIVVVGSGPGALQLSYCLGRLGIAHAVLSDDAAPGGMFRRWPFFQRLLSWTKPFALETRKSRYYERYDWNSLLAEEEAHRAIMPEKMDGTSYFPSRPEMEQNLVAFAQQTGVRVRYGCRWEATRHDGKMFTLVTSEGEYRAPLLVFAVGVAEPWRPATPGVDKVPHYADTRPADAYRDKRIFIIGKQNSGFELASGLLQWSRQIVLASPSPTKLSVNTRSLVGVRARYVQPYEEHVLGGGGVIVLDASIEDVTRGGQGYRVRTRPSGGGDALTFEVDEVIAATGFVAPLRDLPGLGVATFGQSRLPAQTAFWESASVPGIYFAGTISQGAGGLKKHGIPSNSGAVHGYRYNARILAGHLAETHFAIDPARPALKPEQVTPYLLREATRAPELWHQRAYLARAVSLDRNRGVLDEGIQPLTHFLDTGGPDAVAMTVEANGLGDIYPAVYVRRSGVVTEHLLPSQPLLDFETAEHQTLLAAALKDLLP